jgi:hypothetical protein
MQSDLEEISTITTQRQIGSRVWRVGEEWDCGGVIGLGVLGILYAVPRGSIF